MDQDDAVVAVFANHAETDAAVKRPASDDFAIKHLSVIGQGYHTEETVAGFCNVGDRVKFWSSGWRVPGRDVGLVLQRLVLDDSSGWS